MIRIQYVFSILKIYKNSVSNDFANPDQLPTIKFKNRPSIKLKMYNINLA